MQIQSIGMNKIISFESLCIPQQESQEFVIKIMNKKQLESLLDIFEKESTNPVNAIIYSDDNFLLKAKITCKYKLEKFKENYRQIPIIESK